MTSRRGSLRIASLLLLPLALTAPRAEAGKNDRTRPPDKEAVAMDYGPYIANTFEAPGGNLTLKGVLVRLDKAHDANVLFDTELCRVSCAWVGPMLHLAGRAFSSDNDFHSTIEGGVQFATGVTPGWASGDRYDDPRNPKDGPLPHDWVRYKGLYLNGNRIVLSYTVGTTSVLELFGASFHGDQPAFTRDLRIGPHAQPLELLALEAPQGDKGGGEPQIGHGTLLTRMDLTDGAIIAAASGAPAGSEWHVRGNRRYLKLPPSNQSTLLRVSVARFAPGGKISEGEVLLNGTPQDPEPLTHGGPARWPQTVTTTGELAPGDAKSPYVIDTIAPPDQNPYHSWLRFTGIDFFPDGHRAALCTWSGDVWIVSGIDHDLKQLVWKRFATGLNQPMGVKIVDGVVHTVDRSQITRLVDLNGDGEADAYECVNNDCTLTANFHEMAFDLQTDSKGNFIFSKSSAIWAPPLRLAEHAGSVLRVSKDGEKLERLCYGLRAPNGVSVGPDDTIYCTDNQGNWVPACPINVVKPGAFYGYAFHDGRPQPPADREPPLCWIPYGRDKSAGTLAWNLSDKWGPFKDHMVECSYDCSILLVVQERVGDVPQGGVIKFPLKFPSGVMRGRFNPTDGQLYLAGLRGWSSRAVRDACFQRVRYTGRPVCWPAAVRTLHDAMEITFTVPLDPASVDAENVGAEQFNVVRTGNYGSSEFSVTNPKKAGHDPVEITSAKLQPDGRTVRLSIPGLRPVTNLNLTFKFTAADGSPAEQELDYTLNKVP